MEVQGEIDNWNWDGEVKHKRYYSEEELKNMIKTTEEIIKENCVIRFDETETGHILLEIQNPKQEWWKNEEQ